MKNLLKDNNIISVETTTANIKIIKNSNLIYIFCKVMNHVDLNPYLMVVERRTGRLRCELHTLLIVLLFAFMEKKVSGIWG